MENKDNNNELEFNRQKREGYEQLMKESSTKHDDYWDRNNPFVRILLFVLAVFIIIGVVYYFLAYKSTFG